MLIARHHVMLPEGVPEWVHLVPAGTFKGADGRGPYKLTDPQAVITASMADNARPVIDENHSTDFATVTGQPSPARGYIVEMQARADGIWGKVDWTPPGLAIMNNKEYRGISPVFRHKPDGTILSVLRVGLTNAPNLTQLTSLHHQETGMDLVKLRAALGLPETADEAAILAAATGSATAIAAHRAQIASITTAAGLSAGLTTEGIVTALQAHRASATDVQKMTATIVGLQTQVSTMQASQATAAATAFVDGAIKAGAPINPLRDHYITRHVADPAAVEKEIAGIPKLNVAGTVVLQAQQGSGTSDADLTDADKSVIAKMNLDPKAYLEQKKKNAKPGMDGRAA